MLHQLAIHKIYLHITEFDILIYLHFRLGSEDCACRKRIDAFEMWCWIQICEIPWTVRHTNISHLEERQVTQCLSPRVCYRIQQHAARNLANGEKSWQCPKKDKIEKRQIIRATMVLAKLSTRNNGDEQCARGCSCGVKLGLTMPVILAGPCLLKTPESKDTLEWVFWVCWRVPGCLSRPLDYSQTARNARLLQKEKVPHSLKLKSKTKGCLLIWCKRVRVPDGPECEAVTKRKASS